MTTEEKAKRYDEALNWMRELYPGLHDATKEDAEHYFPELKESKDEKIRKRIRLCLDECVHSDIIRDYERDECLAYLKKQKEQKPTERSESFEDTLNTFLFNFANSPSEDCEPKEYIKEHADDILKAAYKELRAKLEQDIFEAKEGTYILNN